MSRLGNEVYALRSRFRPISIAASADFIVSVGHMLLLVGTDSGGRSLG